MADLELPFVALIPYSVQIDDTIPDAIKIYFGQIVALSKRFGYIFATDEALAKMKNTSIKNIERWHKLLEDAGHIKRETYNVHEKNDSGKWLWKKKRKIYINESFTRKKEPKEENSNNVCEPLKNEGSIEPLKNEGYNKTLLNKHLEQQQASANLFVCSFEDQKKIQQLLQPHGFKEKEIVKLYSVPLSEIENAVKAYDQFIESEKPGNPIGWIKSAIKGKWKPNPVRQNSDRQREILHEEHAEIRKKNRKFTEEVIKKYEDKFNDKFSISVDNSTVVVKNGIGYTPVNLLDKDFKKILDSYVKNKLKGL